MKPIHSKHNLRRQKFSETQSRFFAKLDEIAKDQAIQQFTMVMEKISDITERTGNNTKYNGEIKPEDIFRSLEGIVIDFNADGTPIMPIIMGGLETNKLIAKAFELINSNQSLIDRLNEIMNKQKEIGMLERLIENWLTKASEKSFQIPFCYILANEGYTILHLTRHCGMEFGKDIIALDPRGIPCGFQLKGTSGGKIKLKYWQTDLVGQIDQLLISPLTHPSIPIGSPHHKSFFVTNGELEEEVF